MNQIKDMPLVSVGIPTFNRPELLERALASVVNQTYAHLEIIISDNASTDPRVAATIIAFTAKDSRIRALSQESNVGAAQNFFHVLNQASANFFMWAADDDYLEPWFIEKCVEKLLSSDGIMLAMTEAQYVTIAGGKLPFIAEGLPFRESVSSKPAERIKHLLRHNYGNLVYGLFRKEALMHGGDAYWSKTALRSSNEVPPLLLAAMQGEIIVMPAVGLYKCVPETVYLQVVWENVGGWLPLSGRISGVRSLVQTWLYHWGAMKDIESGIKLLPLKSKVMQSLFWLSRWCLLRHFCYLVACFKPRRPIGESN